MTKYQVTFEQMYYKQVEVEAASEEEACDLAWNTETSWEETGEVVDHRIKILK